MRVPVPVVSREQMIEVDRIMIEELGIQLIQMMENAGRHLARYVIDRFHPSRVTVLAGSGGNGGGGMVAARHLANWGVTVAVTTTGTQLAPVPRLQADILEQIGVRVGDPQPGDVVIDAIIGYSLNGPARGAAAELIALTNAVDTPVVALDVPSGVDVDTGTAQGPAVVATATVTLAAPKAGLVSSPFVGDLVVADISVPPAVFRRFGLTMPADLFAASPLVQL